MAHDVALQIVRLSRALDDVDNAAKQVVIEITYGSCGHDIEFSQWLKISRAKTFQNYKVFSKHNILLASKHNIVDTTLVLFQEMLSNIYDIMDDGTIYPDDYIKFSVHSKGNRLASCVYNVVTCIPDWVITGEFFFTSDIRIDILRKMMSKYVKFACQIQ